MAGAEPISFWWDSLNETGPDRPGLSGDCDVDVAIVGGGFTGLWTARTLLNNDPSLRVLVIEREICGFGASGRNGGWASAYFSASDAKIARENGLEVARSMRRAMNNAVVDVGQSASDDGIDCDFQRGGTIMAARSAAQRTRALHEVEEARTLGISEEDFRFVEAREASLMMNAPPVFGATFNPHCAAIHPAKLVRGLALSVERFGGTIVEHTSAVTLQPGSVGRRPCVVTAQGTVRADVVVRATEGWTSQFASTKKAVIPVYSLMIATEPLTQEQWDEIGLSNRETFADHRHMVIYGQRTADGRIAFGGRGAPYHFGSRIDPSFDHNEKVFRQLRQTLVELFPALGQTAITHQWGGPLGIPRDWYSSVGLDRTTGMAWAGGYVGDGVTTSNLAGRTLSDLILEQESELTALPWVNHRSPVWEPEPLRWLGVNGGLIASRWADSSERRHGTPSRLAEKMSGFLGH